MRQKIIEAEGRYARWGLDDEIAEWGYTPPSAADLSEAIFAHPTVEFNRVGHFQDVTLRLIASRVLEIDPSTLYVQHELARKQVKLPPVPEGRTYHLYASANNVGAVELIDELRASHELSDLRVSSDRADLASCECLLVLLRADTWTSGAKSNLFTDETVDRASILTQVCFPFGVPAVWCLLTAYAIWFLLQPP